VKKPYKSLSEKYAKEGKGRLSKEEAAAYVEARMPATQAVVTRILSEVAEKIDHPITSLLDLGAGPGTASLAAEEIFSLEKITLVEENPVMADMKVVEGDWLLQSFIGGKWEPHDLVIFSYSLGEIDEKHYSAVLQEAWDKGKVVLVVEPGTPRGFAHILKARQLLIDFGGQVIAPCPHEKPCPMKGGWCHFAERLPRTSAHRKAKGGSLGWEDEKFSYVVVSKSGGQRTTARVLHTPKKGSGHIELTLCMDEGIEKKTVSRKEGPLYKRARKLKWGDDFLEYEGLTPHTKP